MSSGPDPLRLAAALLLSLAGCLCVPATVRAEQESAPALTALEAGPFGEADAVVLGVVIEVTDVRAPGGALGRQVARVRVERAWKGDAGAGAVITVIVQGQRPTLDPAKPSVPYFRAGVEERFVLFLSRSPGGASYGMKTLFDLDTKTGAAKIAAVDAVATVAAIQEPAAKAARTVALLTDMLKSRVAWAKAHGARELAWLARVRPESFDARTRNSLRRLPPGMMSADERYWLREVFRLLEQAKPAPGPQAPRSAPAESDPWRRVFLDAGDPESRRLLLARLVRAGLDPLDANGWWAFRRSEPSVRLWFVRAVGDSEHAIPASRLRALYAAEEDADVREGIVRAVGLLGGARDVPWLAGRTRNLALRRATCLALARIRTDDALAQLRITRALARTAGEQDLVAWIDYLLSEAFAAAERKAGRPPGPR